MIAVRDVTVRYDGADAVRGVSFEVGAGDWVVLIGPNGAGKTSVLRAICGLVPFAGEVRVARRDIRGLGRKERARAVAYVPQVPETPHELTVAEYVLLGRTPHIGAFASESAADRAAASRALERLELEHFVERPLGSLSGGELQRAVLARALAQEAHIVLLDEPTTALDLGRQQQVLELVDSLRRDGLTVLSTMHDLTLAGQYGERLLLLDGGRVVADGPPDEVLSPALLAAHYDASVRVLRDEHGTFVLPLRG